MIVAALQARASSGRLPGKVLLPLAGAPMLLRQIERLQRAETLDRIVLATSDRPDDDPVAAIAAAVGVGLHRGSLDDVLDRMWGAVRDLPASHVVRVTGDCPLIDPTVVDAVVRFAVAGAYDYASNTLAPTFPDGLDVEVATRAALGIAWREARGIVEREHVMPFLTRRPKRFRLGAYRGPRDLSGMRWTVDELQDYRLVMAIYDALYPADPAFTTDDVLALLAARPELAALNTGIDRNEGLRRSEAREAAGD